MKNVHRREMAASIEQVRPWLEAGFSATERDAFPRDVIGNWRENPRDTDPLALIPEVTRMGHGPFSFRFVSWDGARWRVRVETPGFPGWHGFDLEAVPGGCWVTHTLELRLSAPRQLLWTVCFAAIHDWAVEAALDRMEEALRTGTMPAVTTRPLPWLAARGMALARLFAQRRSVRSSRTPRPRRSRSSLRNVAPSR
jgi:hypothetical protein